MTESLLDKRETLFRIFCQASNINMTKGPTADQYIQTLKSGIKSKLAERSGYPGNIFAITDKIALQQIRTAMGGRVDQSYYRSLNAYREFLEYAIPKKVDTKLIRTQIKRGGHTFSCINNSYEWFSRLIAALKQVSSQVTENEAYDEYDLALFWHGFFLYHGGASEPTVSSISIGDALANSKLALYLSGEDRDWLEKHASKTGFLIAKNNRNVQGTTFKALAEMLSLLYPASQATDISTFLEQSQERINEIYNSLVETSRHRPDNAGGSVANYRAHFLIDFLHLSNPTIFPSSLSYIPASSDSTVENKKKEIQLSKELWEINSYCPINESGAALRQLAAVISENFPGYDFKQVNAAAFATTVFQSGSFRDSPDKETEATNMNRSNNLFAQTPLNLILYGPPGTGKTFSTVNKALEIIEGQPVDSNEKRSEIISRYKKLVDTGRIGFTTFHQSFSYEDFVEGIRTNITDEDNENEGTLNYKIASGAFKKFCDRASTSSARQAIGDLGENPTIWKVSLKGTGKNEIRSDCFKNNRIRIGYANVDVENLEDLPKGTKGKGVLKAFYSDMKIGDVVCSCWSDHETDGIGIITGHASHDEALGEYPNVRSVRWLSKNELREKPLDVSDLNDGKGLTLASIYRLGRMDLNQLFEKAGIESAAKEEKPEPYVFIIDEINRGNVSAIFGELITLLEEDKRLGAENEQKVTLPYSGDRWGIPSNVYIIGTMNTADRSLTQLDTALRRRFEFEEMMPRPDLLNQDVEGVDLAELLKMINLRIEALYDREHTIGHAYFMGVKTLDDLRSVFARKVIPLLQEYFFEDYERIRMVLNDREGRFIQRIEPTLGSLGLASWDSTASDEELQVRYQIRNQEDWTSEDFRGIYGSASETNSDAE